MAKKNNVIEEIQELIQQIKNEYQEGVDYKFVTGNEAHKQSLGKDISQEVKPKNCAVCGKLSSKENGQMKLWDGEKITGEPRPNILGYFHPECAKKYFAGKEQSSESNTRIKEKLLRNLDKICIGPSAYLENAEYLKNDGAESDY
ncbi:11231_t:CDS:2 [Paraglomus occultum]|uniref:11231_t:CDS:1 n=1 Tax=Paraglomus occultum TaxID=144539 RepID=A0A9N9CSN5_9GLOM|nr:11231_t:CDS:2 [Paraglomus occultum]